MLLNAFMLISIGYVRIIAHIMKLQNSKVSHSWNRVSLAIAYLLAFVAFLALITYIGFCSLSRLSLPHHGSYCRNLAFIALSY